jgi:GNAT superfamily N-acetyltransferase
MEPVLVRRAVIGDIDHIVPLFDAYRQFYRQPSDLKLAHSFLLDRFRNNESIIFLAFDEDGSAAGFTQLFPSFSSGACRRIFILNDLFVKPEARRRKVGHALLKAAAEFAASEGAARLTLLTALDNAPAQALYESAGWMRDSVSCMYHLTL